MTTIPPASDTLPILLMTRPRPAADGFVAALGLWPGPVIYAPLLEIVSVAGDPPSVPPAALIFTSAHAVGFYTGLKDVPAYCVGPATQAAAEAAGFTAEIAGPDASTLIATLPKRDPPQPLLHVRGRHVAQPVAEALRSAGLKCEEQVVYDQAALLLTPEARNALSGADPVLLPIFSPRSADLLGIALAAHRPTAPCIFVAISGAVSARLRTHLPDTEVCVAAQPNAAGMVKAVDAASRQIDALEGRPPLP